MRRGFDIPHLPPVEAVAPGQPVTSAVPPTLRTETFTAQRPQPPEHVNPEANPSLNQISRLARLATAPAVRATDHSPSHTSPPTEAIEASELAGLWDEDAIVAPTPEAVNHTLDSLPKLDSLPATSELAQLRTQYQQSVLELQKPVTLGDLQSHIQASDPQTPEVAIGVIQDRYVLHLGEPRQVAIDPSWEPIRSTAQLYAHTHPGKVQVHRVPSPEDLYDAAHQLASSVLVSSEGLTLYRPPQPLVNEAWQDFCARQHEQYAALQRSGVPDVEINRMSWLEFATTFGRCEFLQWGQLPSDTTLLQAVRSMAQNSSAATARRTWPAA